MLEAEGHSAGQDSAWLCSLTGSRNQLRVAYGAAARHRCLVPPAAAQPVATRSLEVLRAIQRGAEMRWLPVLQALLQALVLG